MQILSLKDAQKLNADSAPKTYQEAAYIGWLRLDKDSQTVHETLPDLKLNSSGFYDMATLLATDMPVMYLLSSPWGRTLAGRKALELYIADKDNSPLTAMVAQCKSKLNKASPAMYFIDQLKLVCKKPMTTKQIAEVIAELDNIKQLLSTAPGKIDLDYF